MFYGSSNSHLQCAIIKYSLAPFIFIIVEIVQDESKLLVTEQYWLDWLFSLPKELRYNFLPKAGNTLGFQHTEESKAKISSSLKGRKHSGKVPKNATIVNVYDVKNNSIVCSFYSQSAAAKWLGITQSTVSRYIRTGKVIKGQYVVIFSFED